MNIKHVPIDPNMKVVIEDRVSMSQFFSFKWPQKCRGKFLIRIHDKFLRIRNTDSLVILDICFW
jgi:hypothetical protein